MFMHRVADPLSIKHGGMSHHMVIRINSGHLSPASLTFMLGRALARWTSEEGIQHQPDPQQKSSAPVVMSNHSATAARKVSTSLGRDRYPRLRESAKDRHHHHLSSHRDQYHPLHLAKACNRPRNHRVLSGAIGELRRRG